jgi:uncharacterized protein (TIGR02996 family)
VSAEIRAFLQAIAAAPEDDLPRLVFADWLDENGRPERADFIRVEVDIARTQPGSPDRSKLFERQDALLKAHRKEWFALFDGKVEEYKSERGFVIAIRTGPEQFLTHADQWFGTQPITEMRLSNVWSDSPAGRKCLAKEIFTSPYLGQLKSLDLENAGVNAAGIYWLSQNPAITELQELNLRGNRIANEGVRTLAAMPGLAKLEVLEMTACGITDLGARSLTTAPYFGNLRKLNLIYNRISDEVQRQLRDRYGRAVPTWQDFSANQVSPSRKVRYRRRGG